MVPELTGVLDPKSPEIDHFFPGDSRRVPRPQIFFFFFPPRKFAFGRVRSYAPKFEEPQKYKWCTSTTVAGVFSEFRVSLTKSGRNAMKKTEIFFPF